MKKTINIRINGRKPGVAVGAVGPQRIDVGSKVPAFIFHLLEFGRNKNGNIQPKHYIENVFNSQKEEAIKAALDEMKTGIEAAMRKK